MTRVEKDVGVLVEDTLKPTMQCALCISSSQGQQDPRPVGKRCKVERQDHLPKALYDPREARAGICGDCVESIPGPGQGGTGKGAEKNGQHDLFVYSRLTCSFRLSNTTVSCSKLPSLTRYHRVTCKKNRGYSGFD